MAKIDRVTKKLPSTINATGLVEITKGVLRDDLAWVLKARINDDSRYMLKRVDISSDAIACSDGIRLHALNITDHGIPVGVYEIVSVTRESIVLRLNNDGIFPAWREVVPDASKYKIVGYAVDVNVGAFLSNKSESPVNVGFVADAIRGTEMEVFVKDQYSPIMFRSKRYTAVFMPIRWNQ
jgi:hypothetical protein